MLVISRLWEAEQWPTPQTVRTNQYPPDCRENACVMRHLKNKLIRWFAVQSLTQYLIYFIQQPPTPPKKTVILRVIAGNAIYSHAFQVSVFGALHRRVQFGNRVCEWTGRGAQRERVPDPSLSELEQEQTPSAADELKNFAARFKAAVFACVRACPRVSWHFALLLHLRRSLEFKSLAKSSCEALFSRGSRRVGGGLLFSEEEPTERNRRKKKSTMAENKMGPNLQAGAGFLAKRVQKSLNRAQEKVSPSNRLFVRLHCDVTTVTQKKKQHYLFLSASSRRGVNLSQM